jgi:hypothetical protein
MRVNLRGGPSVRPIGQSGSPMHAVEGSRAGSTVDDLSRALALGLSRRQLLRNLAGVVAAAVAGRLLGNSVSQSWAQQKCQLFPMDVAIRNAENAAINKIIFVCGGPAFVATAAASLAAAPATAGLSAAIPIALFSVCAFTATWDRQTATDVAREAECVKINQAGQCTHPEGISTTDGICCDSSRPKGCRGPTLDYCCGSDWTCCEDACCQPGRACQPGGHCN